MSEKEATVMSAVTPPVFPETLINEPKQTNPAPNIEGLGPLSHLVGTWTNQNLGSTDKGGTASPYSYNIMPLPVTSVPAKYILKNFTYYEEITFSPINGNAPNRGGDYNQNANVLFYEQRIYFADGPDKDKLVHAENGSWLFLVTGTEAEGPYGTTPVVPHSGPIPQQSVLTNVAKQISVPHGNSILAQGGIKGYPNTYINNGPLHIDDYPGNVIPSGINQTPYTTKSVGNPFPDLNMNPNQPLQHGVNENPCVEYIQWGVDTENPVAKGSVTNIPFEKQKANVIDYNANYWLQAFTKGGEFTQLSYNQTILMNIPIDGTIIKFPHITCNTLTKKQ
ncbi:heme-binding protein [Aquimarina litoralis]|uniref:heme-binding protein n=1 Tax=Aquimarina litoralis TaxID=584605 RepID=UPI001C5605CD|nr:heme-binding protein [Aquimarina litoralis]